MVYKTTSEMSRDFHTKGLQGHLFLKHRNIKRKLDGILINPYAHKEKRKNQTKGKKKKKKKKSKDVFQHLIERIFIITEEALWKQRNLDRHQPKNKTRYTEVIKTDREIRQLYGLADQVRPTDKDTFYSTNLKQRLSQPLYAKWKWIIRWKAAIRSSIKRSKREATDAKPIWTYYSKKKPEVEPDIEGNRRNKRHKQELRNQRSRPLREIKSVAGFEVIRTNRSTSRCKNQPMKPPRFKKDQPSVTQFFKKMEPADHYGDAGND